MLRRESAEGKRGLRKAESAGALILSDCDREARLRECTVA
jgi:hypothetical protein